MPTPPSTINAPVALEVDWVVLVICNIPVLSYAPLRVSFPPIVTVLENVAL